MSIDNALRTAIGFFVLILVGSLVSALVGGLFALLIAAISPEFVQDLFHNSDENIKGYAFAVGMIWGLFIGAGASALPPMKPSTRGVSFTRCQVSSSSSICTST